MDVALPVFLYDVATTATPPRVVVSCRTADAAQELAVRLNQMRAQELLAGTDDFCASEPRSAMATVPVTPGGSVRVRGYDVDTAAIASVLNAAAPGAP